MDKGTVVKDIDFIKDIVRRSHRRIDGHCFHSVHWGLIVLVWYPLINYFAGRTEVAVEFHFGPYLRLHRTSSSSLSLSSSSSYLVDSSLSVHPHRSFLLIFADAADLDEFFQGLGRLRGSSITRASLWKEQK